MKRIIIILCFALVGVLQTGCVDFLKERNTTSYDKNALINSETSLEAAVLGIHRQVAGSGFKMGHFCEWLLPASGLGIWGNTGALENPQERWACQHKFTRYSKHPEAYETFKNFYRAIYLCNHLLDIIDYSSVDEDYVKEIKGEVYFLRAMSYFYLVRLYGDVSLHLTAPLNTTADQLYKPRETFWTVYCQIVKDLNDAELMMRDYNRMVAVAGGNASGRVCDYAAVACRSLVYLTIGTLLQHPDDNFWVNRTPDFSEIGIVTPEDAFKLALDDANAVLTQGPFELYPDYRQLFRWTEPEDWQLKERIWAMPRSPESKDAGSGLTLWALPRCYNGTQQADNFGRCRPDRWFFQKWCERYGGVKGTGSSNKNVYVNSQDPRMDVNIIHSSFMGETAMADCYPASSRIYVTGSYAMRNYGMPFYKKYYDPTFNNSDGNSDLYVMRLAEVYLIAAEATAWLNGTGTNEYGKTAIEYVNVLLDRARKSVDGAPAAQPADWTASDFSSKQELIDAIVWERFYEMPFEHHEYFDTHRLGANWIINNISKPKNKFLYLTEQEDFVSGGENYIGYRTMFYGADFKYDEDVSLVRKGLINAYPYDELVYNPFLDETRHDPITGQNPVEVFWK